jgi:hypothetical protein
MSVNCDMKSSWLNCRDEHLSLFCWKAYTIGLCSVMMVKCRASNMWRKYRTAPIDGQQLPAIGAVLLLRQVELPVEESERLPDVLYLLEVSAELPK